MKPKTKTELIVVSELMKNSVDMYMGIIEEQQRKIEQLTQACAEYQEQVADLEMTLSELQGEDEDEVEEEVFLCDLGKELAEKIAKDLEEGHKKRQELLKLLGFLN